MSSTRNLFIGVLVLGGVQLGLLGAYLVASGPKGEGARSFRVEALDEPAPPLVVARGREPRALPSRPHLVHFWATWCAPCREELPTLLEAAETTGTPLVAVTDEPWPLVERYFDDEVPEAIVWDPVGSADAVWGASTLPVTFVVRERRVVARIVGAGRWDSEQARSFLVDLGGVQ